MHLQNKNPLLVNSGYSNFSLSDLSPKNLIHGAEVDFKNAKHSVQVKIDNAKDAINKNIANAKADIKAADTPKKLFVLFASKTSEFNPGASVPRAAALALVRLNWMGIARKLRPAVLSHDELIAKHYDLANAAIVKQVWDKNITEYWHVLGGDMSALAKAVNQGFDKPIFKTKKVKQAQRSESGDASFDGGCEESVNKLSPLNKWANEFDLSQAQFDKSIVEYVPYLLGNQYLPNYYYNACEATCIASLISAGGAVVVAAIGAISKKAGAKDSPFIAGSPEAIKAAEDEQAAKDAGVLNAPPVSGEDEAVIEAAKKAAAADLLKLGRLDSNTYEEALEAIDSEYGKIAGIPKTYFWIGVSVLGITGLALLIKKIIK